MKKTNTLFATAIVLIFSTQTWAGPVAKNFQECENFLTPLAERVGSGITGADAEKLGTMTDKYLDECKSGRYPEASKIFDQISTAVDVVIAKKK